MSWDVTPDFTASQPRRNSFKIKFSNRNNFAIFFFFRARKNILKMCWGKEASHFVMTPCSGGNFSDYVVARVV
jgi:hypothetical protein